MNVLFGVYGLGFVVAFFRAVQGTEPVILTACLNAEVGQAVEVLHTRQVKGPYLIGCILLFLGCADNISVEKLGLLNGYWEIEEVIFPDGSKKYYTVNTSVDYFSVKGKKGYRKKVQPKFDGTYDTSNDADLFVISERDDIFSIHYNSENSRNPMAQRSEELVTLSKQKFSVRNSEGFTYVYKRFEPIKIQE